MFTLARARERFWWLAFRCRMSLCALAFRCRSRVVVCSPFAAARSRLLARLSLSLARVCGIAFRCRSLAFRCLVGVVSIPRNQLRRWQLIS